MFRFDLGSADFQRILQELVRIHGLTTELKLAFADAGEIQQIIDQSRFEFDISANQLQ